MLLDPRDEERGEGEAGAGDGQVPDGDRPEPRHAHGLRPQHQLTRATVEQLQQLAGLDADLGAGLENNEQYNTKKA